MSFYQTISAQKKTIDDLAARYGAKNLRVFGSVASGDDTLDSDVDILAEFETGRNYFDLIDLKENLEQLFGRRVDLMTPQSLHWYIRDKVLQSARALSDIAR